MSNKIWNVNLCDPYLDLIEQGKKTAEGRVFKGKFKEFLVGDQIKFVDKNSSNRTCLCEITYLHKYESFKDMITKEGIDVLLPTMVKKVDEGVEIYRSFPGFKEKEPIFGVVSIGIKVLK